MLAKKYIFDKPKKPDNPIRPTPSSQAMLALEAMRLRYAFMYDPVLAMSVSKVDPLPHQIEAVYGYVLKKPRIRFMLAHDPGAGKTIMAGLVIKELKLRGAIKRILIVVPGHLKEQWRWEMKDKVDENFEVVDREYFNRSGSIHSWDADQLITSIDFAKREDVLKSLDGASFDLVIVDEAHKMSAYAYGRTTSKTKRYRLGETLSVAGRHLLFLTATPHKGDTNNFRLLLDLLEPGFFAGDGMIEESIKDQDNPLFLRRAKEGMTDFDGTPLFMPRSVSTPDVRMSPAEKTLYNSLSKYVTEQYNKASNSSRGQTITFALIILQRRFASSPYALLKSLRRRKARLENLKISGDGKGQDGIKSVATPESAEEMTEKDRWAEEEKWEVLSMAQNPKELQKEIDTLTGIIAKTEKVIRGGKETKIEQLKNTMKEIDATQPDQKMLIFTESKDTMEYLVSNIQEWGYSVNTIHGAMSSKDRKNAESVFRDKTRVMVATEAAGEGINLQFCHLMVNYDLPWNPNRLEQRMGRIHRYGQKHPVHVFNLVASDTREGEIMQRLFEKLEEIKAAMGSDKIFDVISEVIPGKSLSSMLLDATVRARKQEEILTDIDEAVTVENDQIKNYLNDSLAVKYMDRTKFSDVQKNSNENSIASEYLKEWFVRALDAAGGSISENGDVASVKIPQQIASLARSKYGMAESSELETAVFDKSIRMANPGVDLVTFGHPVFDATLEWAEQQYRDAAMSCPIFVDPSGQMDGYLVYCRGDVTDGTGDVAGVHMSAFFIDRDTGSARKVLPAILLDLDASQSERAGSDAPKPVLERALAEAESSLRSYTDELSLDRGSYIQTVQKYGTKSLDALMERVSNDILILLAKKRSGGKVDLAIYNKREERTKYRQARRMLETRIETDVELTPGMPEIVGVVRVIRDASRQNTASLAPVESAMGFERSEERNPSDVSGGGYGFDIKSSGPQGVRYVLAKPAQQQWVALTANEWMRSKILGDDSYLYLVDKNRNVTGTVRNPTAVLHAVKTPSGYVINSQGIKDATPR